MVSVHPIGFRHYLSFNKHVVVPRNMHRYFYASFEDALWDLLDRYQIRENSKILIPSFYCSDVITNIKAHGLIPITFPMDKYFNTPSQTLSSFLTKHHPSIIVILHAAGITNKLIENFSQWKKHLNPDTLLIEDSVHRIVNPQSIHFKNSRHFVIDSLRKVMPLPGSNLYSPKILPPPDNPQKSHLKYRYSVLFWWAVFQLCLTLHLFKLAEAVMLKGYDIIGDSYQSAKGWRLFQILSTYINYQKIYRSKINQVNQYLKNLKKLKNNQSFFLFPINPKDYHQLKGYPLGLHTNSADKILNALRNKGLMVRFELNDCLWSNAHKVIYLPLGPHLTKKDINNVCDAIISS